MKSDEYMVTIPQNEYKDLISKERELENLLDYMFSGANLTPSEHLNFNKYSIESYLVAIFPNRYRSRQTELKRQSQKS